MQITAVSIHDFKRVRDVEIRPPADRAILLLGGKNAQGKSSVLDALTAAFGGKRALPPDPVRHGAKEAAIEIEIDGGKLFVRRVVHPDGETTLEVRDPEGAVRSPQAMLDKLFGPARFLDPLAFLALPAKEQRASLMKLIPDASRIDGLNEKRDRAFTRRTELGRDLSKAHGELARLPEVAPGEPLDVAALVEQGRAFADEQRAGDGLGNVVAQQRAALVAIDARRDVKARTIGELEAQLERARQEAIGIEREREQKAAELVRHEQKLAELGAAWTASAAARAKLDQDLARANEHNRTVYEARAQAQRRAEALADVTKIEADVAALSKALDEITKRKDAILAAAKLPVPGLAITDDGLMLGEIPFAQASAAERHRVALALAIAATPGLHDVWIRDGALYDDEHLALVEQQAAAAGKRVWIERVGTRDAGVIEIRDGQVVG